MIMSNSIILSSMISFNENFLEKRKLFEKGNIFFIREDLAHFLLRRQPKKIISKNCLKIDFINDRINITKKHEF